IRRIRARSSSPGGASRPSGAAAVDPRRDECRPAPDRDRLVLDMRNLRWSLAGLFVCGLPTACADPCIDDGLGQDNCPPQSSASETEGETDSSSNTDTVTATATATLTMTGSQTATDSDTLDGTATETSGGSVWCVDADGDGFGDPDM